MIYNIDSPEAGEVTRWLTVSGERTVLVVVRTVATLTRLLDIVALTMTDRRIQTVFTYDAARPAILASGVSRLLERIEAPVVSWQRARTGEFDLAVAASENDRLDELAGPVLLVPHGVGFQKYYPGSTVISGMNPRRLVRDGQVVPSALALAHVRLRERLAAVCPPAAARSVVVGDPCLDRMLGSAHRLPQYRAALGAQGRRLVVVASTWGPGSLLAGSPDLPDRLVAQLPADEYRVAVIMHPGIWAAHGPWQVRAWLSDAQRHGLAVIPPLEGWQAALTAASCVISDQGSISLYAAALDKPLLLAPGDPASTVPGSALAALAARTARLDPDGDLRAQLEAVAQRHIAGTNDPVCESVFEEPGRCAERLRPLLYRLLELPEPPGEPRFPPVPTPSLSPEPLSPPALVVGAQVSEEAVALVRLPDLRRGRPHDGLDFRHLVVDATAATASQLGGATIVCTRPELWHEPDWLPAADALLARWPTATMIATPLDERTCAIRTRELAATVRAVGVTVLVDPLLFASLAYVRLATLGALPPRDRVRVGQRVIPVVVEAGRA